MNTTEMDTDFASAVRNELALIGTKHSRLQRHQRRTRAVAVGVGALALAGATTGAAVVVNGLPGETTVVPVGNVVTATHTGTGSIDLGPAPSNAAVVVIDLNCEGQTGTVSLALSSSGSDGADGLSTNCAVAKGTTHITDGLLPPAGSTSITITADPTTTWTATAQYATSSTKPWEVNAHGQSYGVAIAGKLPDLSPAQATNGKQGYISTKELFAFKGQTGSINVYESDGTTVIGQFPIGGGVTTHVDDK